MISSKLYLILLAVLLGSFAMIHYQNDQTLLQQPKEVGRIWGNYTIHNCGDESQIFQSSAGVIYCGSFTPFACSPHEDNQWIQVCGRCEGVCSKASPQKLKCGATVNECHSCAGYYARLPC